MEAKSEGKLLYWGAAAVLAASLFFRFYRLSELPAINGDEAWLGTQVAHFLRGEIFQLRTPSGNFISPFFFISESALLALFKPSFLLLRLPAAFWSLLGLLATFHLYRRAFGNKAEALALAALTSVHPLHLGYSRLGWDISFILFTAPFVLFSAVRIVQGKADRWDVLMFCAGIIFSIWVHLTSVIFAALVAASIVIVRAEDIAARARGKGRANIALWGAGLVVAIACGAYFLKWGTGQDAIKIFCDFARGARNVWRNPPWIAGFALQVGDILSGHRAGAYLAGTPETAWTVFLSVCFLGILLIGSGFLVLKNQAERGNRFLGILGLLSFMAMISGFKEPFLLSLLGRERYVLWVVPFYALMLIRLKWHLPHVLIIMLWTGYFAGNYIMSLSEMRHQRTLHRTFVTARPEPKLQAADFIRKNLAGERGEYKIVAEDHWILYPLRYLLEPVYRIEAAPPPSQGLALTGRFMLIGWAGSLWLHQAEESLRAEGRAAKKEFIFSSKNVPILAILYDF